MYINNKYITLFTGEPCCKYPPKLYMDWFRLKANLKAFWRDCNSIQFRLGLFNFHLCVIIEWGWIERERTEREEETYQRTQKFVESLGE